MKRYIALVLAFIMLLGVLAGCGGKGNEDVGGTISSPPADSGSPDNRQEDEGKEIDFGEISGGAVYTNDFAGITFTLPEGWAFATEEELAELMNISAEELFDEDNEALIEYAMDSTVYDAMAYSTVDGTNLIVMFENTARYLIGAFLSVEAYMDALESNFDLMPDFTYETIGRSDITLGGADYRCLSISLPDSGIYQDYIIRREGKYMICIAFTASEANPAAAMGEYFS